MSTFSADDVLALGITQERSAARLYAEAARKTTDEACKALLAELSQIEMTHEKILLTMRERLTGGQQRLSQSPEAQVPLAALAGGPFLPFKIDPNTRLTGNETTDEILRIAIAFEENAAILMTALKDRVPPEVGQHTVDALVAEEHKHRELLVNRLAIYQAGQPAGRRRRRGFLSRLFRTDRSSTHNAAARVGSPS